MEMVKRAIASHPQFTLNDIEMQRHEISYSIDTLLLLKKLNPHHHYYFIVGMDAFLQFDRWREWQHIISLCDIIIVSRHKKEMAIPPLVKTFLKKENREHHIHYLLIDPIAISATHIRADIAAKKQLIPGMIDSVREYILENEIYRV
ncbi:MAG: nicotinic acid mononucleotide adenylyltransferase [uncultured bacterium]|nr:MAG: nicotinic acid mononucleotide adenylyltransferase [uncultured bacterium]